MTNLFVFGDSIVQGAWDPLGGWVQRVRTALDRSFFHDPEKHCITYNMGMTGQTSAGLLSFFLEQRAKREKSAAENMFLFAIGMNDCTINRKSGLATVGQKDFEDNIRKLIEAAKADSRKIGFIGLTPVDEARSNPVAWSQEKALWNTVIHSYNHAAKAVCAEHSVKYLDIWDEWQAQDYQDWLFDGIHPNETGHQKIARAVLTRFLKPAGWYVPPENENGYILMS